MVKIINPFFQENPIAGAIKSAGKTLFGDTLTPALKRQTLRDKEREEFGTEQMARIFGAADTGAVDHNAVAEMGVLGGMKPEDAAMWGVYLAGNKTGPRGPLTTNAMAGAGKYEDSAENLDLNRSNAFNMNESDNSTSRYNNAADNTRALTLGREGNDLDWAKWFLKPEETNVDGEPGYATQGALAGNPTYRGQQLGTPPSGVPGAPQPSYSPILTKAEQSPVDEMMAYAEAFKVANPTSTPEQQRSYALTQISKSKGMKVYGESGNLIMESGGNGYEPAKQIVTEGQREGKALDNFTGLVAEARGIAAGDPTIFGAAGQVRRMGGGLARLASNLALMSGSENVAGAIEGARQKLVANGFNPNVLDPTTSDPDLYNIESMGHLLAFSAAEALAGQEGRSVSDQDVQYFKNIVGDPTALFASQDSFVHALDFLERQLRARAAVNKRYTGAGNLPPDAAPAAPVVPGTGGEEWTFGPNGPVRVK